MKKTLTYRVTMVVIAETDLPDAPGSENTRDDEIRDDEIRDALNALHDPLGLDGVTTTVTEIERTN